MIYIIEDNMLKASQVLGFLSECLPHGPQIHVFMSFQTGLKALENNVPQLVILDMTLPTFDRKPNSREGRVRPLGGYDLMRKMKLKSILSKVIVLTQLESFGEGDDEIGFKEITAKCEREFSDFFVGSVYFDQNGIGWHKKLAELVQISMGGGDA